jgi:uncharacterized protein DUF6193
MMRGSRPKWWSITPPDHYPEIGFERTLGRVLLQIISSGRQTFLKNESEDLFSARFGRDSRMASVETARDYRRFYSSLSCNGVTLARLETADLGETARAVALWLIDELTPEEMKARLPKIVVSDLAFDAATVVTARWNALLSPHPEFPSWPTPEFIALVRAAANRPLLRQLAPVVSMLCFVGFSRTLQYPFAIVDGYVQCAGKDHYLALGPNRRLLGEGTLEEVLDIVERTVPPDTGPAVHGNADDLFRSTCCESSPPGASNLID